MPLPQILPALLNSASPWATTIEDLQALFDCPHTGAVTTRTSLLDGFEHDPLIHQHVFFDPRNHSCQPEKIKDGDVPNDFNGSLNTLGYSPFPLRSYLFMLPIIVKNCTLDADCRGKKPFIISVTGSADAVRQCCEEVRQAQTHLNNPLCVEINLSCPNIPNKPPPAYSADSLAQYLRILTVDTKNGKSGLVVGIKTPPYTYHDQFQTLIDALLASCEPSCPVDFITATNTLGSSLVLSDVDGIPALASASSAGIGGMAGAPLHPLALGNVKTIRSMLDRHAALKNIDVIGVGGVGDESGYLRMRAVGAVTVGVATALGREGIKVFSHILPHSAQERKPEP
nr:putative dihydroorotate dehydrogenase a (fumarate) [Quercus suber]